MKNQRKRTRIQGLYRGTVEIRGREVPFRTQNLSLKGLLCQTSVPLEDELSQPGTPCTVTIPLSDNATIVVESELVRVTDTEVAIDFKGMDEETYRHLSNCVRLMSMDPDAIEREQVIPAFKDE